MTSVAAIKLASYFMAITLLALAAAPLPKVPMDYALGVAATALFLGVIILIAG